MSNNNQHVSFAANFDEAFPEESNDQVQYPTPVQSSTTEQVDEHQNDLIAGGERDVSLTEPQQQVIYATENSTSSAQQSEENKVSYVPTLIPEDIRHQYGINALTLDQIHRSIFVGTNTPIDTLSVQELSNFFSFCGSVEKIIIVDDLNSAVVCLENNESFSTSLLLNEMKLNEQTTLYIFNLCDLLGIPRKNARASPIGANDPSPSSQSAIQALFQEGYIQSKNLFEQLKTRAVKLDEENDISKKVQQSLTFSRDQWVKFAKHMNENVEDVKLKFVPVREAFNLQTVSQKAEVLNTQTQQYLSFMKSKVKEFGKDVSEKIKQQDQKLQLSNKASEVVSKNWSAMTSYFKGFGGSKSGSNSSQASSHQMHTQSQSTLPSGKSLPPVPTKTQSKITSLEEDDSMWNNGSSENNTAQPSSQPTYSLNEEDEDEDFPVQYQQSKPSQENADSFFD